MSYFDFHILCSAGVRVDLVSQSWQTNFSRTNGIFDSRLFIDITSSYLLILVLCGKKFSCYNVFTFYMSVNKIITSTTLFFQVYEIIFSVIHRDSLPCKFSYLILRTHYRDLSHSYLF